MVCERSLHLPLAAPVCGAEREPWRRTFAACAARPSVPPNYVEYYRDFAGPGGHRADDGLAYIVLFPGGCTHTPTCFQRFRWAGLFIHAQATTHFNRILTFHPRHCSVAPLGKISISLFVWADVGKSGGGVAPVGAKCFTC
jgi:hypothetical protein